MKELDFSAKIKFLRRRSELSQHALSKLAGVPRSTIAHIESGYGNPSIQNLVQIARALQVSVDELLQPPQPKGRKYGRDEIQTLTKLKGRLTVRKLLPDPIPGMEFDQVHLKTQSRMKGIPHSEGSKEYLVMLSGEIEVYCAGEKHHVKNGELLAFKGDEPHSYFNPGRSDAHFISVVTLGAAGF
ncbi:XRE family transcriptional regulator [Oligoflexaceae bacterium]|nr:XRE family transcriptional regulator [Oligoflexaceae bacterium]